MTPLRPASEMSDVLGCDRCDAETGPARPSDCPFRCMSLDCVCATIRRSGGRGYSPITCTSPSSRQHIRGVTLGLGFLRNPSPYALRLAPAPMMSESTYEVTPYLMAIARLRRVVLSTGFLGSAGRSVLTAAGALSCAVLAPAHQPLPLGKSDDGFTTPLLALPIDAC